MGNKNAQKREKKKPAKTQPKAAPARREDAYQAPRIVKEAIENS